MKMHLRPAALFLALLSFTPQPARAAIKSNLLYILSGGTPASENIYRYIGHQVVGDGQVVGGTNNATTNHALLWDGTTDPIDLHPAGFDNSSTLGVGGRQQVGFGLPTGGSDVHALLWNGTNAAIDLNPNGFTRSYAKDAAGGQQVGVGSGPATGGATHALLWNGSNVAIDLTPDNATSAMANATDGRQQVGWSEGPAFSNHSHATVWTGTNKAVDLHPASGFQDTFAEGVGGGQQVGWGVGSATGLADHALLWNGNNTAIDLNPAGVSISYAYGAGSGIQVGFGRGTATSSANHAFAWQGSATSAIDLQRFLPSSTPDGDVLFWTASFAYAVEGTTVYGTARDFQGFWHAVSWTGVPEPTSLALFGFASIAFLRRRRNTAMKS